MVATAKFLSYDFGTSGVKSILIDETGNILADAISNYPMQMPHPGWVEQKPEDYWRAIVDSTRNLLANKNQQVSDIKGIVFTTQAMGIIPMSEAGELLHPNISWVDGRAEEEAEQLMRKFGGKRIFKSIVGIEITGKDVIPKLMWLKKKRPEIYQKTAKFLDVNGFLKYKCTGRMVAEWSGACSYAFNLKKKDWEKIFFRIAGIDIQKLPELVRSTDEVGLLNNEAANELGLAPGIPVFGGCDDTQSSVVGSGAIEEGKGHIYLGTAAQLSFSTKKAPKFKNGAVALQGADPNMNLVLGVTEAAGVNVEWFIRKFYKEALLTSSESAFEVFENDIKSVAAGSEYLIFTPWFLGERCPVSTTLTRSTLFNLSHIHGREHMARALCEGVAYNIRWKLENMERDFNFNQPSLRIIGGGSSNETWCQIIADVTKKTIITTNQPRHAGAIGGAMCAMVGNRSFKNFEGIHSIITSNKSFIPNKAHFNIYDELYQEYKMIYKDLRKAYSKANKKRFEEHD